MIRLNILKAISYGVMFAFPLSGQAQTASEPIQPFSNPVGFAIASRIATDPMYGANTENANWHVTQWGAPGNFAPFAYGEGNEWFNGNSWASYHIMQTSGIYSETIAQNSANMPCLTPSGAPAEHDFYIEPNGKNSKYPSAVNPTYGTNENFPNLAQLASFSAQGTFTANEGRSSPSATPCAVNSANALYTVILVNKNVIPEQMFWYEIGIARLCVPASPQDPGNHYESCEQGFTHPSTAWYWTGTQGPNAKASANLVNFGASDPLPVLGTPFIDDNLPHALTLNLLPRLVALISSGDYGIDPNLADWKNLRYFIWYIYVG